MKCRGNGGLHCIELLVMATSERNRRVLVVLMGTSAPLKSISLRNQNHLSFHLIDCLPLFGSVALIGR